ncbi:hypothetical protein [Flavobacterium sp. H122]|uniref:hypothetical protein n=1 Tax=Flavobacterium sp. H122 TaxID=2529860 RepID=UPI0010AAB332|nr:hypothetical protein [Flavobacterium sp. H122]
MNALTLFLTETLLISIAIVLLHRFKDYFGIGLLLIFLGSVQFIQTILTTTVYNEIFKDIVISPGSAVLYTSTLCCILLIFHTEGVTKTRTAIFGLLFSNVLLAFLSAITVRQLGIDSHSLQTDSLKEIFSFDVTLFLVGAILMFIDFFVLIIIYQFVNFKLSKIPSFFKIYLPLSSVALFDSVVFYSINFISLDNEANLLNSNIIAKQIAVLIFSLIIYMYLRYSKLENVKEMPQSFNAVASIFSFYEEKNKS